MTALRKTKAFTLIELIVVIVIIGILAAVAGVAYNSFISQAHLSSAQDTYSQVVKMVAAQSAFDEAAPADSTDAINDVNGDGTATDSAAWAGDVPSPAVSGVYIGFDAAGTATAAHLVAATVDGYTCTGLSVPSAGTISGTATCS